MDKQATRARIRERCLKLAQWCKDRDLSYVSAYALIYRDTRKMETRKQQRVIDALIADGLYVPSENDEQAAA